MGIVFVTALAMALSLFGGVVLTPVKVQAAEISDAAVDSGESDGSTEDRKSIPEKDDDENAAEETDGFSYYQVEFTYDGKQYVLPGDESVALTDILSFVGIINADGSAAGDADITAAEGSNDTLFTVEKKDGIWMATAITAFHTDEWLRVAVDGVEYEIVVTDAEYNSNVSISNLKKGDVLKPGTTILGKMQLAFEKNRHSLTESGTIVDDNIGTEEYNSLSIVIGGAAKCGTKTYYPIDEDGNHVDKWVIIHVYTYTDGQYPYFMLGGYSSIAKYSETTTSFTYDGKNKSPITDYRNVTIAGTDTAKNAGSYTTTVTPKSGCTWSDGTTGTKTVNWSILPQSLTIPTLSNTSFTYKRGTSYKPTVNDYDKNKKVYSKIQMRLKMEEDSEINVWISVDEGAWESVYRLSTHFKRTVEMPIIPRRCDKFAILITGTGYVKIESMVRCVREGTMR